MNLYLLSDLDALNQYWFNYLMNKEIESFIWWILDDYDGLASCYRGFHPSVAWPYYISDLGRDKVCHYLSCFFTFSYRCKKLSNKFIYLLPRFCITWICIKLSLILQVIFHQGNQVKFHLGLYHFILENQI